MITIERKVHFGQGRHTRRELQDGDAAPSPPMGRVPRVSRLMALAIRLDQLIRDAAVADQAELARLGHVTRARLTQIMNLLGLTPDVQEQILFLLATERGRDVVMQLHDVWNEQPQTAPPGQVGKTRIPAQFPVNVAS
jgi:hypothetical protein